MGLAALAAGSVLLWGCASVPKPGDPIEGLTRSERALFERGRHHGGEAAHARQRFQALSEADRAVVVDFLRSL